MVNFTGVLAVLLLFLSGPYRTMQKRWPRLWGPTLSVWAHSNVSLAAAATMGLHLGLVGAKLKGGIGALTWSAMGLFTIALVSGVYGLYGTQRPSRRRRWLKFHRVLTNVLYLTVIPHVLLKGFTGWPVGLIVPAAWALWTYRGPVARALARANWPLRKAGRAGA